jgi:flagellar motor switch protein FliN
MTEILADISPQPAPHEFLQSFSQIWSDSFSQVLGQITGSAAVCAIRTERPGDLAPAAETDLRAVVTCSGGLRGEMTIRLAPVTVIGLAQIFMSEPATPEAPPTAEHGEAAMELLRQVSGVVSSAAKTRWGELQLRVEPAPAAPSWPAAASFWLLAGEAPVSLTMEFGLSAALVAELRAEKAGPKDGVAPAHSTSAATDSGGSGSAGAPQGDPGQTAGAMGLLMDVHLALTLRFGARVLLLREVLDLSPGAVVELDRKVQEPVDLLLDGRLVARGELVVIDGNYGLRVTDVSALEAAKPA